MLKRLFILGAALVALCHAPARAQFIISEFMADNVNAVDVDEDTSHSDWVEIQNVSGATASLNGWYLTDDAGNLRKWQFPTTTPTLNVAPGGYVVVWCSDKNRKAVANKLHTNFKLSAGGEYLALVKPDGVSIAQAYGVSQEFNPFPAQFPNSTYGRSLLTQYQTVVAEDGAGKAKIPSDATDFTNNFTGWNSSPTFDDSTWQSGNGGFGFVNGADSEAALFQGLIGTGGDLGSMPNNAAFIRYKFNLPSLENVVEARLRVKFDDGYSSYINGSQLTFSFAPQVPAWNSAATNQRDDQSANFFITTNFSASLLVAGTNVLAFALSNDVTADAGAIIHPWLELKVTTGLAEPGYFVAGTRGAANAAVKTAIGPSISDTTDQPPQPAGGNGSPELVITTKVAKTLRNIASNGVVLKYRRMYEAETAVIMVDNGTAGDAVAGDGTYTGKIPTTALQPGEMIRWRIEARDVNTPQPAYSYDPPYPHTTNPPSPNPPSYNTAESEMYFGTIATPVLQGNTLLPVLHWFIQPGTEGSAENETGTRSSFFFQPLSKNNPGPNYTPPKPIFYDNVNVRLHGQSSSGFPKKSHDLSFSKDNKFIWKDGEEDSSGLNLLSNYADKSKVRNTLAWYGWESSGHPASHYSVLLRVQRNAAFQGLYDIVENANAAFLKRSGFDGGDALYKVYNSLESAAVNTSNSALEKKNPDDLVYTDAEAFVAGISDSNSMVNRLKYVYDNVDVESLINFLAMHSIILNRDFGHKNYYIYRDTAGTGEWMPLPWDQDLSFGHTWNSGPGYFDDDIHSQGPLQTGGGGNRLMQIVYNTPELNAMFVRRLRTLAEQFYGNASETNGLFAQKANTTLNLIDPNPNDPSNGMDDADLEMRKWGYWVDNSSAKIEYNNTTTGNSVLDHTVRAQAARIVSTNPHPPYPGANPYAGWGDGSTSLPAFLPGRRDFFFKTPAPTSGSLPLPGTQVASPTLVIEQFNPNPGALGQGGEYFVIRNTTGSSVDISGWKITGDINLTFRGGTVLLPQGSAVTAGSTAASYINQMVVANKPKEFRARAASPKANEFRFVVGPYDHQLSARGGSITLSRPINPLDPAAGYTVVLTQPYTGTPTDSQNSLRITELNYRPAPPIQAELDLVPGLVAGDFEFIEITNTGNTTLNLGGAKFDEGIAFTFPAGYTLAAGQRCILVASQAAFEARYGTGLPVLGNWEGALDNAGERLRLVDAVGEEVLDFTYQADWFPLPSGQYRTLVMKSATPDYTTYSTGSSWALSTTRDGTPNGPDTGGYSSVYEGWRLSHFTNAELPTQASPNLAAALLQDPDGDGLNNFMEYCFGRQPKTADTQPLTTPGRINVGGVDYLTITFTRAKNSLDVTYQVEGSSNLTDAGSWSNVGILVNTTDLGNGREQVTYRDNTPISVGSRSLHVRVFKP